MELTEEEALNLLNNFKNTVKDTTWIEHSICVGNTAGRIAEKLNLDKEKAKVCGYIHDIGKGTAEFENHPMQGYKYIKSLGYDDEYANICLTHSYLNNDINCVAAEMHSKDINFIEDFITKHEYTIYDKLITLCDLLSTKVNVTIEKRLIDIYDRRGIHKNTVYHLREAQKLKKEFDEMLGYSVYKLFPEIIENL